MCPPPKSSHQSSPAGDLTAANAHFCDGQHILGASPSLLIEFTVAHSPAGKKGGYHVRILSLRELPASVLCKPGRDHHAEPAPPQRLWVVGRRDQRCLDLV